MIDGIQAGCEIPGLVETFPFRELRGLYLILDDDYWEDE